MSLNEASVYHSPLITCDLHGESADIKQCKPTSNSYHYLLFLLLAWQRPIASTIMNIFDYYSKNSNSFRVFLFLFEYFSKVLDSNRMYSNNYLGKTVYY